MRRRRQQALLLLERLFPPEPRDEESWGYANYLHGAPSFLTDTRGRRGTIDIWFPALPLAVDVAPRFHGRNYAARSQLFLDLDCPYLLLGWRDELTLPVLVARLKGLSVAYSPRRCELICGLLDRYDFFA